MHREAEVLQTQLLESRLKKNPLILMLTVGWPLVKQIKKILYKI